MTGANYLRFGPRASDPINAVPLKTASQGYARARRTGRADSPSALSSSAASPS
jgi:hypothetical protein